MVLLWTPVILKMISKIQLMEKIIGQPVKKIYDEEKFNTFQ